MTWWLALVVVALGVGWLWLRQPEPITVSVVAVERGLVEQRVVNTRAGTVKACERSRLSLAAGGLVTKIHVKEGDVVEKDQLLVELFSGDLQAQITRSEARASKAELEVEQICINARQDAREARRVERVHKRNLASVDQVDNAMSRAEASAVACKAAALSQQEMQALVEFQQALYEKTRLRAPFAGVVAEVSAELGEFSTPSPTGVETPPLVDLLTNDCHFVSAPIDEVDAAQVQLGHPVRVTLDAWRGEEISGKIRRISNYVQDFERQARTVEIEVELLQLGIVKPLAGYSADVAIIVDSKPETLRIPSQALMAGQTVLVLPADGEALEKRSIQTGLTNWNYTEITDGLRAGEQVVISLGAEGVVAGAVARAREQATADGA